MTIIEQIKAEIERRKDICSGVFERNSDTYYQGKAIAYDEALSFLSSLEPVTDCHELDESEKPVPNDLEEAAWDCVLDSVDVNNPVLLPKYKELLTYLFVAGATWQKEQDDKELSEKIASAYQLGLADKEKMMLKEAVEGEVIVPIYEGNDVWSAEIKIPGRYVPGDKVRVIVLPKED